MFLVQQQKFKILEKKQETIKGNLHKNLVDSQIKKKGMRIDPLQNGSTIFQFLLKTVDDRSSVTRPDDIRCLVHQHEPSEV